MSAKIIDGAEIARKIRIGIKKEVETLNGKPGLAAIIVGQNPASKVYVNIKRKTCDEVGIYSELLELAEDTSEDMLLKEIDRLNNNEKIHAILLQLPIPKHIDTQKILSKISVKKDVDGFGEANIGKLLSGNEVSVPCTPKGVIRLLEESGIEIEGKNAVVIGRSNIVGKPTALMLLNRNATVTICHSKTQHLESITKNADIVVSCVGIPRYIKGHMIKAGAAVIDVGINKVDGKIVGDVDFESVREKAGWITPVPKGVGPMTVACLLQNTLDCYRRQK